MSENDIYRFKVGDVQINTIRFPEGHKEREGTEIGQWSLIEGEKICVSPVPLGPSTIF